MSDKLKYYAQAMEIDQSTGKPMPKVSVDMSGVTLGDVTIGEVGIKGSYSILKGAPKPQGVQNDTLLEYDTATGESKVYKFISGDWREL